MERPAKSSLAGPQPSPSGSAPLSQSPQASLHLLIAIARSFKAIDEWVRPQLAAHGLAMTEFAVLEVLYHKGRLPVGEIAEAILVTGASTTYVVTKLEKRGLMRRQVSGRDRRVVFGEITAGGRKLMRRVFPLHAERLQEAMSGLSTEEKRAAAVLLRKLGRHAASLRRKSGQDQEARR